MPEGSRPERRRLPSGPRGGREERDTRGPMRNHDTLNPRRRRADQDYRTNDSYRPNDSYRSNGSHSTDETIKPSVRGGGNDREGPRDRYRERDGRRNRDFRDPRDSRGPRDSRDLRASRDSRDYRRDSRRDTRYRDNKHYPREENEERFTKFSSKDLEGVIPIDKRDRTSFTLWDQKPEGFGVVSAEKAKLLGIFIVPGPNKKPLDQKRIDQIIQNENSKEEAGSTSQLDPKDAINAKRLIVRNIDTRESIPVILEHFSNFLSSLQVFSNVDSPIQNHSLHDNNLVLQFENYQLATVALALNGYTVHDADGIKLEIERPQEYTVPVHNYHAEKFDENTLFLKDSPNKLLVSNIPAHITKEELSFEISKLVSEEILYLELLLDKDGNSKGIAFMEFKDAKNTEKGITSINELILGNQQKLSCLRACIGYNNEHVMKYRSLITASDGRSIATRQPTNVLQLLNLFDYHSLAKGQEATNVDKELDIIRDDITKKIALYAKFFEIKVPKLEKKDNNAITELLHSVGKLNGFGKVFVKFKSLKDSEFCYNRLNGIKYFDRAVLVSYFSEKDFELGIF